MSHLFTSEELTRIQAAVEQAEAVSGGEIVPAVARQSSFYEVAYWRGASGLALLTGILLTLLYLTTNYLLLMPPYLWLLIVLSAGLAGAVLVMLSPAVKRAMIGSEVRAARVLDQAKNLFYDYGISRTEQRTGILLYVSFWEHRAVILADVGISELVSPSDWEAIIRLVTAKTQAGRPVDGICEAIVACGQLLADSGVQAAIDDEDSLPNDVRYDA